MTFIILLPVIFAQPLSLHNRSHTVIHCGLMACPFYYWLTLVTILALTALEFICSTIFLFPVVSEKASSYIKADAYCSVLLYPKNTFAVAYYILMCRCKLPKNLQTHIFPKQVQLLEGQCTVIQRGHLKSKSKWIGNWGPLPLPGAKIFKVPCQSFLFASRWTRFIIFS